MRDLKFYATLAAFAFCAGATYWLSNWWVIPSGFFLLVMGVVSLHERALEREQARERMRESIERARS